MGVRRSEAAPAGETVGVPGVEPAADTPLSAAVGPALGHSSAVVLVAAAVETVRSCSPGPLVAVAVAVGS